MNDYMNDLPRAALIIPTRNAGPNWTEVLYSIRNQTFKPSQLICIDSESTDDTAELAKTYGFIVKSIPAEQFNHGRTRNETANSLEGVDIVIFLTQDARPQTRNTLDSIIRAFSDPSIGAAYGRQCPRTGADAIEAHARYFSYPKTSAITSLSDVSKLGMHAAPLSNSFAAYRLSALKGVGGFPDAILGEDVVAGARLLLSGWRIYYSADAVVIHSHSFSYPSQFRRYFDIGVFHTNFSWLLTRFGTPHGRGLKFILSELSFLKRHSPKLIPKSILFTVAKFAGYHLGRNYKFLPISIRRYFSAHPTHWL